jgi:O-6-methylguanine DNA methyltransferase
MNATTPSIPQADPGAGYRAQKAAIDAAVARALGSGWYILGKEGEAFEAEYAAWQGAARAVGGANGANNVAVLIPCHRVIAADGTLGGYAYGLPITAELLRREGR